jgi:hypothetical protein
LAAQTQLKGDAKGAWLTALKRYAGVLLVGNLVWEFVQLPLYTLWYEGPWKSIVFAAVHCTGGDLLIAGSALMIALFAFSDGRWPHASFGRVAIVAGVVGFAYTIFSEWLNTEIRGSWAVYHLDACHPRDWNRSNAVSSVDHRSVACLLVGEAAQRA